MAFQSKKLPRVSFSCGGDPREVVLWVEEEEDDAKVEDGVVVSAPMVLAVMAAVVVDIVSVAKVARCNLSRLDEEEALLPCKSVLGSVEPFVSGRMYILGKSLGTQVYRGRDRSDGIDQVVTERS